MTDKLDFDPLMLMRDAFLGKKQILLFSSDQQQLDPDKSEDWKRLNHLSIDRHSIPKDYKTFFKKEKSGPAYTIAILYYTYVKRNSQYSSYLKECSSLGFDNPLSYMDRKSWLDFVNGTVSTLSITKETSPSSSTKVAEDNKQRKPEAESSQKSHKRPPSSPTHDPEDENSKRRKIFQKNLKYLEAEIYPHEITDGQYEFMHANKPIAHLVLPFLEELAQSKGASQVFVGSIAAKLQKSKGKDLSHRPRERTHKSSRSYRRSTGRPIILVPALPTSLLNIWNVRQLLEEKQFIDSVTARQEAVEDVAPEKIGIVHEGRTYEVVDRPEQFGPEDWDRVICVVCSGHEWQFRNWKWESPDELFQHVRGIYFKWSHEALKDEIKAWRVITVDVSVFRKVVV
ncbi:11268_t:CDS:1 [Paraglomus brasilianum]|uniref:11268_t:CDS:1 n=1 Tax=Paraglomus brasilianum TaxID=144538 RepID=A0A9N9C2L7_9GLOM|nr:11268_t:CDS:1 [Paraglomus brasilianum]